MDVVSHAYPPELLNRIDDFVMFQRLSQETLRDIVDIRVKEVQENLNDRRITLQLEDGVKDWLAKNGYSVKFGARPLQRLITKQVLNPLALRLIQGQIRSGETAVVRLAGEGLEVVANHEVDPGAADEKTRAAAA